MSVPSAKDLENACRYAGKKFRKSGDNYVPYVYEELKVLRVSDADGFRTVEFSFFAPQSFDNSLTMVHGGASSTLCAVCSILSLLADPELWSKGQPSLAELDKFIDGLPYTRGMAVQILKAIPLKSTLTIRCQVLSRTKSNAYISISIFNQSGNLVVSAVHDMIQSSYHDMHPSDPQHIHAKFNPAKL